MRDESAAASDWSLTAALTPSHVTHLCVCVWRGWRGRRKFKRKQRKKSASNWPQTTVCVFVTAVCERTVVKWWLLWGHFVLVWTFPIGHWNVLNRQSSIRVNSELKDFLFSFFRRQDCRSHWHVHSYDFKLLWSVHKTPKTSGFRKCVCVYVCFTTFLSSLDSPEVDPCQAAQT